jgi:hypothetical protein
MAQFLLLLQLLYDDYANSKRLSLLWLRSEQWLAAVPTILLAGMYGAAAFSLLAVGPAWLGFLVFVVPAVGMALWAFVRPV